MRQSIAIAAALGLSALATGASAQSRYGPRPVPSAGAPEAEASSYEGSLLRWRGKPAPSAAQATEPEGPQRPEPVAPWAQRIASLTPPPARVLPEPAGYTPPAPEAAPEPMRQPAAAPARVAPQPRPAGLPTSLYDAPAPIAAPPAPAAAPYRPAPPPQTALLGGPPAPRPAPAAPNAAAGPRFYSVYREYGVTPDLIPVAPGIGRGAEVQLKDVPQTAPMTTTDDTQYIPPRSNQSTAASNRTF